MFSLKNKNLIKYSAVALFILVVSFLSPVLRKPVSSILEYPLFAANLIRREILGIIFFHRNMVQSELCREQIDIYKRKLIDLDESRLENKRLKNLLALKEKSSFKVIAASVIARSVDNWSSVIIINKGASQGIRKGYVVMNYYGLAGKVVDTTATTSKIMLLNDPHIGASCLILRSRQEGLVSGTLGNSLVMRYIPKESDVVIGDTVVTSGLTEEYPKGLAVGVVVGLGDEYSGLSRYAVIKPAVNFSSIEEVLIIIP